MTKYKIIVNEHNFGTKIDPLISAHGNHSAQFGCPALTIGGMPVGLCSHIRTIQLSTGQPRFHLPVVHWSIGQPYLSIPEFTMYRYLYYMACLKIKKRIGFLMIFHFSFNKNNDMAMFPDIVLTQLTNSPLLICLRFTKNLFS